MKTTIDKYIKSCPACQQNKADNHAKYRYLQKMPIPEFLWACLTMDFIVSLPPSVKLFTGNIYNVIIIIVDKHTKYTTIIPFSNEYTVSQITYIFLDRVVRYKGFPKEIITDRDKLFTSKFWKILTAEAGIKARFSTAYYPETNKQTKKINKTLKQYLRHYVNL